MDGLKPSKKFDPCLYFHFISFPNKSAPADLDAIVSREKWNVHIPFFRYNKWAKIITKTNIWNENHGV
jgi:hypothetical protein